MFRRHRRFLILGAIAGLAVGSIYARFARPIYATTANIILEKSGGPIDGQSGGINDNVLYTQVDLLRSSPLLAVAINNSGAEAMQIFAGVHNKIAELKQRLQVGRASRGTDIEIELDSTQPREAERIINALITAYREFQGKQQHSQALTFLTILQQEKARIDVDLQEKNRRLTDLQDLQLQRNQGVGTEGIDMQRVSALSQALTVAQLETIAAKRSYTQSAIQAGIDTSQPDWVERNAPDVTSQDQAMANDAQDSARAQLFSLRQQRDQLARQYMPGHPALKQINQKINDILKSLLIASRQRWMAAADNEKQLQDNFDKQEEKIAAATVQDSTLKHLDADVKRDQDQTDALDKRIGDLSTTMINGTLNVPMIEQASTGDLPIWPRLYQVLPLGLLAGALAGLCAGSIWEATGGIKIGALATQSKSNKAVLGLTTLATVPRQGEVSIRHVAWSAHLRPESNISTAFRAVKDALDSAGASSSNLSPARTILIASPLSGEGRTISASNLAITLAKSGKRVCLVDADLRSPSLAKTYAMRDDFGLADILAVSDSADQLAEQPIGTAMKAALDRAIQRTVIERLDLIASGPTPESPEAMLNRPSLASAIEELTLKYDHVVFDAPPVLSASDSRIIAANCDATLLVLSQEASTKKIAEQCRDGLSAVGATITGVIVNSAPRLTGGRGTAAGNTRERKPPVRRTLPGETTRNPIPQLPFKTKA